MIASQIDTLATELDALVASASRVFSGLQAASADPSLARYAAALSGGSEQTAALERGVRLLHVYTRFGDAEGQAQACEALAKLCVVGVDDARRQAMLDHGVLASLVVVVRSERPEPLCAATELLAAVAGGSLDHRRAVPPLRSSPLVGALRHATDARFLRAASRLLAELASEPACVPALLREGAARSLTHVCRSKVLAAHADAVDAVGRLARADGSLLKSASLLRVLCRVAAHSVLEGRLAAVGAISALLQKASRRPPLIAAHVVEVLLGCCESLNADLKIQAVDGLRLLVSAECNEARARRCRRRRRRRRPRRRQGGGGRTCRARAARRHGDAHRGVLRRGRRRARGGADARRAPHPRRRRARPVREGARRAGEQWAATAATPPPPLHHRLHRHLSPLQVLVSLCAESTPPSAASAPSHSAGPTPRTPLGSERPLAPTANGAAGTAAAAAAAVEAGGGAKKGGSAGRRGGGGGGGSGKLAPRHARSRRRRRSLR